MDGDGWSLDDATKALHLQARESFAVISYSYTNISQVLGMSCPTPLSHPLFPTNWPCVPRGKPPIPTGASHVPARTPHEIMRQTQNSLTGVKHLGVCHLRTAKLLNTYQRFIRFCRVLAFKRSGTKLENNWEPGRFLGSRLG